MLVEWVNLQSYVMNSLTKHTITITVYFEINKGFNMRQVFQMIFGKSKHTTDKGFSLPGVPSTQSVLMGAVSLLTFVTGISFGFGTYITYLSVQNMLGTGLLTNILEWCVIIPASMFQTVLWCNAYYVPARAKIDDYFAQGKISEEKSIEKQVEIFNALSNRIGDQNRLPTSEEYKNALQHEKSAVELSKRILPQTNNNDGGSGAHGMPPDNIDDADSRINDIITQIVQKDPARGNLIAFVISSLSEKHKMSLNGTKIGHLNKKTIPLHVKLYGFAANAIPKVLNAMNYISINSFGVFFSFYTVVLTILFQTKNLSLLTLSASHTPLILATLAMGLSAGCVCALFLTSESFRACTDNFADMLAEQIFSAENYINYKKVSRHTQKLYQQSLQYYRRIAAKEQHSQTWAWLSNRPILGNILAFGCALSLSICNYYTGIQAAIMMANLAILFTPGKLTSPNSLLNASLYQKLFGVYSAIVTTLMTAALLQNAASSQRLNSESDDLKKEPMAATFFYSAVFFSTLGQIFCNLVNIFAPHGIISALRLVKAPCERLLQTIFGLFSMGGTIIVTKLQAESAEDVIAQGCIPAISTLKEMAQSMKDRFTQNHYGAKKQH